MIIIIINLPTNTGSRYTTSWEFVKRVKNEAINPIKTPTINPAPETQKNFERANPGITHVIV